MTICQKVIDKKSKIVWHKTCNINSETININEYGKI